ncbi:uncharacterized protein METZ01_LOCUS408023 [marine metagenome]|uniref:DOD-type homing endonuclease domain-containing protein n=1 Tax=marine metagenome TaxID=408172 RepID=A0A382W8Y5_9ZZZZ
MDYYTIGFLYNKGYVDLPRGAVRIQCQDANILKNIKKTMGKGSIHGDILRIYDKVIAEKISYYRSLDVAAIPPKELYNFVRGYFDAHGCVYIRQNKYAQVTMTLQRNVVYYIQNILIFNGIESIVKPLKSSYQLTIAKKAAIAKFRTFIYHDSVCRMESKYFRLFSV